MREKLTKKNQQTGFTIIEVVLVLAIAGLIFLIVFLALPQLQKSRRDTQRKADAGRFLAALESYAGNNNGDYPAGTADGFNDMVSKYMGTTATFTDPSGGAYAWVVTTPSAVAEMQYLKGSICAGPVATSTGANTRSVSVVVWQESGGSSCQDNQ